MSTAQILADRREDDALVRYLTRGHRSQVIRLHGRSPARGAENESRSDFRATRLLALALSALRGLIAIVRRLIRPDA